MDPVGACNLCGGTSRTFVFRKDGYDLVRCSGCGLLYVLNPPSEAEREDSYSFEGGRHAELANQAAAIDRHRAEAQANLRVLAVHAQPGKLLDVGCSTGLFLCEARSRGWSVRGLEYSSDSASVARQENRWPVDIGELRSDTYAKKSFDVVTMWDVLKHLPDPNGAVDIAHEILAPNGLLVIKTPNADGLFPRASFALARQLNYWTHPEPPGHLYQFFTSTLSQLLDDVKFEVIETYHRRIPFRYSFGGLTGWFRSAKWLLYCVAFAPLALAGPCLGQGGDITAVARRRS